MDYPPLTSHSDFQWQQLAVIPVADCGAPLQELAAGSRLRLRSVYHEQGISDNAAIFLRTPVIEKLNQALSLLPPAYGFEILDGWRSLATQISLRESFRAAIMARHPEYDETRIQEALNHFVADPRRADMTPPHQTGGSVDLTLFDIASGAVLDMGTAFDEPSHRSYSSALDQEVGSPAQQHRRILIHTMLRAGFTNLPTEWWHFDYGNQNWAFFSGQNQAIFGAVNR